MAKSAQLAENTLVDVQWCVDSSNCLRENIDVGQGQVCSGPLVVHFLSWSAMSLGRGVQVSSHSTSRSKEENEMWPRLSLSLTFMATLAKRYLLTVNGSLLTIHCPLSGSNCSLTIFWLPLCFCAPYHSILRPTLCLHWVASPTTLAAVV